MGDETNGSSEVVMPRDIIEMVQRAHGLDKSVIVHNASAIRLLIRWADNAERRIAQMEDAQRTAVGSTDAQWWTTTQAGEFLGRSKQVVIKLCESGKLEGATRTQKRSGAWRIPRTSVLDYHESMKVKIVRRGTNSGKAA